MSLQMGDYPPGCDGPSEDWREMTDDEHCDLMADEIGDKIHDWRTADKTGMTQACAMQKLLDLIDTFIGEHS